VVRRTHTQIVPSGLRRVFLRLMVAAPGAGVVTGHIAITSFMQQAFRRLSDSFLVSVMIAISFKC
jgi:hypothetical protein